MLVFIHIYSEFPNKEICDPYIIMLQAVCNVAPRGIYVCGNTTTTSGLTVTLSRDSATGDFALEAGALILGDQGMRSVFIVLYNLYIVT